MPRALLVLLILTPGLFAQTPKLATIRGTLVRWGTEEPVGQATIELRPSNGDASSAIAASGDNGAFVFPDMPAGSYRIVAFADGFAPAEYGQLRPNGMGSLLTV